MNLWEWLFGIDEEFGDLLSDDDHLRFLWKWPLTLYGNKRQMNIFMVFLCFISMNQIAFVIYVLLWKPDLLDIVAMLPAETLISNIQMFMIFALKIKSKTPELFKQMSTIFEYSKLCSKELKSRIQYESVLRKCLIPLSILLVIGNFALYTWKGGDSKHFFAMLLLEKLGTKRVVIEILFCVITSYIVFSTSICFNVSTYACGHIDFQLLILEENLEKLNLKYAENENYQLHNNQYQKMIKTKLMSCWSHYLEIRRLKHILNEISYWPFYLGYMHCISALGIICIYFLYGGRPSENPGMILNGLTILIFLVLSSENGQLIKSESENMHDALLRTQWYQWNKENRKILLMFLTATQAPLEITSFGIIQSREFYVKVFKGLYSVITCINPLTN